eukprot:8603481-Lingulodinium_polyedra.AAC.1
MIGKARQVRKLAGRCARRPQEFGDLVESDVAMLLCSICKDLATNCKYAAPVHTMGTENSAYALHTIMGDDPVNLLCADNWGAV